MWKKCKNWITIEPNRFFIRIINFEPDRVADTLAAFARDAREINKEINRILYYMKGGITRNEAWQLSPIERDEIIDFLNEVNSDPKKRVVGS